LRNGDETTYPTMHHSFRPLFSVMDVDNDGVLILKDDQEM
jgi:hypothetical protein